MVLKDEILRMVVGDLGGIHKKEVLSQLTKDEESKEEFRGIKNTWALSSSTKKMSETQVENLYLDFKRQLKKQKSLRFMRSSFLKYAALLIFVLLIGAVGFLGFYTNQQSYVYSTIVDAGNNGKSQLHLADGTIVDLEKDHSKIELSSDQKITIDNDKVIELNKNSQVEESRMNEVVVPFGKKTELTLEDGTKVWLNAGSRMAFPTKFGGRKREVFMEGEGYFEVAHNKNIPFYVLTREIAIKVLGTSFNVSAYASDQLIETVLLEGSVSISERSGLAFIKDESLLMANQKASYKKTDRSIAVREEPYVEYAIAWTEGVFKFNRESIGAVVNKIQHYYNVQVILNPGFPTEDLISGKLSLEDSIEEVMQALEVVAKIQYSIDGNKIYIEKRNLLTL